MDRVMPEPWFHGSAYNRVIEAWLTGKPVRPPRPGERQLLGFILPPFQRPPVWTVEQKIRLVESIYAGLPIGAYVVNMTLRPPYDFDGWLLDGQQRWTAIGEYVAGAFPVHGWRFPDLPERDRRWFRTRPVAELETRLTNEDRLREIYERLAYGGTPHPVRRDGAGAAG